MKQARLIGVIHLPALPGSPRASESTSVIARRAASEAKILSDAGFDAVVVENFGDAPFFAGRVPPVTIAAMTACAIAARESAPSIALGINVLRNDGEAALAIALATGATFIRVNVLVGARVTDQGLIEGDAAHLMRARRTLGAEGIQVWADVDVKHSAPLAARPVGDEVADAVSRALADAILLTGEGTGRAVDVAKLDDARRAIPGGKDGKGVPLFVASGVTIDSLGRLARRCDGAIVGSALRADGTAGGPVDGERARMFADAFRRSFA